MFNKSTYIHLLQIKMVYMTTLERSLLAAAEKNDINQLRQILLKKVIDINKLKDKNGDSLLHIACRNKCIEAVEELLKYGADPEIVNTSDNSTPIILVANYCFCVDISDKSIKIVNLLIDHKVNINAVDTYGRTLLYMLIDSYYLLVNYPTVLRLLEIDDINVNTKAKIGDCNTLLHIASQLDDNKYLDIVDKLIKKGAYINAQNSHGETPFHTAMATRNFKTAKRLLGEPRLEIGIKDIYKNTAFDNCRPDIPHIDDFLVDEEDLYTGTRIDLEKTELIDYYKKLVSDEVSKSGVVIPDLAKIIADYMH